MIATKRTTADDNHYQALVHELDKDLAIRDGDEHAFYAQFNKSDTIKHIIVAYEDEEPAGCGAIKQYNNNTMEVKRMFVAVDKRNKGIASIILNELEQWAKELNYTKCILETGKKQTEALEFYKKNNYNIIPNYGQYKNVANSVCFEKTLSQLQ